MANIVISMRFGMRVGRYDREFPTAVEANAWTAAPIPEYASSSATTEIGFAGSYANDGLKSHGMTEAKRRSTMP